jgi:hypothetical protein
LIHGLTREERQLAKFMSDISERCYGAGWQENSEFILWHAVTSGPRKFGQDKISQEEIDELIRISNKTKTWIVFDEEREEIALPLEEWRKHFTDEILRNPDRLNG